jgi:hypothetical protein
MEKTVAKYLTMCRSLYPDFADGDLSGLAQKIDLFTQIFQAANLTVDDVEAGFRHHIMTEKRFPVPADIIGVSSPVTVYQMDYGPLGFGATYHPHHPYVRQQTRLGVDISRYAMEVRASDAVKAKQQAENAPPLPDLEDEPDDLFSLRERAVARRLSWDH